MTHSAKLPATVRVVLFDAVGTLLFPDPPVVEVYGRAGQRHGSRASREEIRHRFAAAFDRHCDEGPTSDARERQRWHQIVADVFRDVDVNRGLFDELWDHFAEPRHWRLFEDVAETLTGLRQQGLELAIASNFDQRLLRVCEGLGLSGQLDAIFHSARLGFAKPHVQFFARIATALDARPEQLLLVGDDPINDYFAARAAGWHALRIDRSSEPPDSMLSDLRELIPDRPK